MRILGIDPGTREVGWGVLASDGSEVRRLGSGCIRAPEGPPAERLVAIHHGLQEVIRRHRPDTAVVETVFVDRNVRTAIAIGEARGVAVLSAAELGVAVVGCEPALAKRAITGSGRAGKEQVQEMVCALLGLEAPATDHESDALALALTHHLRSRAPAVAARPKRGRPALPPEIARQIAAQLGEGPGLSRPAPAQRGRGRT